MIRRLLAASVGLVLLQTPVLAETKNIGAISMYLCDGGLDLCSNTISSLPTSLPIGSFTEIFVFNFVNRFPNVPDNVPLLKATVLLDASSQNEFSAGTVALYNSFGVPVGFSTPFVDNGAYYQARAEDLIYPGSGYYVEIGGVSHVPDLSLAVSIYAFDLGPVDAPEPSTWAMMLLGFAGLGFAGYRQTKQPHRRPKPIIAR